MVVNKSSDSFKKNQTNSQIEIVYEYLYFNVATASMVEIATGVHHKCITRYKRNLEKNNNLWQIEKKKCEETGFIAWYLTTNPNLNPGTNQLGLFDEVN